MTPICSLTGRLIFSPNVSRKGRGSVRDRKVKHTSITKQGTNVVGGGERQLRLWEGEKGGLTTIYGLIVMVAVLKRRDSEDGARIQ
jgi:hypothetical protein